MRLSKNARSAAFFAAAAIVTLVLSSLAETNMVRNLMWALTFLCGASSLMFVFDWPGPVPAEVHAFPGAQVPVVKRMPIEDVIASEVRIILLDHYPDEKHGHIIVTAQTGNIYDVSVGDGLRSLLSGKVRMKGKEAWLTFDGEDRPWRLDLS